MDSRKYRVGAFTRLNLVVGVLAYSLLPLILYSSTIQHGQMGSGDWLALLLEVVALQVLLGIASRRCNAEKFPFWRGVTLAAACMRTGVVYFDIVLAGGGVLVLLLVAGGISLTANPVPRYHSFLRGFYANRMRQ